MLILNDVWSAVYNKDVYWAWEKGAKFDVMFKVVDDAGNPVVDAKCGGWIYVERDRKHDQSYAKSTDVNGCVRVTGKCGEWFRVVVEKEGFYTTKFVVKYPDQETITPIVDGKWQPYGETRMVVLKRIKQPHGMLGPEHPPQRKIKVYDKWLGFDLEKGDYLPPMGEGTEADMFVRFRLNRQKPNDWSIMMDVSFTNQLHAGACRLKKDDWSDMKSVYRADTNAEYQTSISFRYCHEKGVYPYAEKLGSDEYLVFRIRTKVDCTRNLLSARYGKLYGPWHFEDAGGSQMAYVFLNKEENDINLEDAWTIENAKKYRRIK